MSRYPPEAAALRTALKAPRVPSMDFTALYAAIETASRINETATVRPGSRR